MGLVQCIDSLDPFASVATKYVKKKQAELVVVNCSTSALSHLCAFIVVVSPHASVTRQICSLFLARTYGMHANSVPVFVLIVLVFVGCTILWLFRNVTGCKTFSSWSYGASAPVTRVSSYNSLCWCIRHGDALGLLGCCIRSPATVF